MLVHDQQVKLLLLPVENWSLLPLGVTLGDQPYYLSQNPLLHTQVNLEPAGTGDQGRVDFSKLRLLFLSGDGHTWRLSS